MTGGLTYMVNDNMCPGIVKKNLMVRLDPALYETSIIRKGCRELDFTWRPVKG